MCVFLACTLCANSPHYDDDKVQHVPAVSDVGVLVHDQAVGNNLQKCLYRENDQEGIFHCFLYGGEERRDDSGGGRRIYSCSGSPKI